MSECKLFMTTDAEHMFVPSAFSPADTGATAAVTVDATKRFQSIDGFGASFTDSSAYLLNVVLPAEQRNEVMELLFHPERGIGLSMTRQPMGSSDYARFVYSFDDRPAGQEDFELRHFSIEHDRRDIIPLLKKALAHNPELKLMASPWSPPGWMKTSGSMITGALREECYEVYARYFVKYIEEYAREGLEIYAVTPENEPMYVPGHYPGCDMPAAAQTALIREHMGPALRRAGLKTKLLCFDHNWDMPEYPLEVLAGAGEFVDGVAWHWYGGEPSAQSAVLERFPGYETHVTECSGGEWVPPFEDAFINVVEYGIDVLNHHAKSYVLWNMALDEHNGPFVPGFGESTCRGVVTVRQDTREYELTLDYYGLAHFSKYIRPGAVRLGTEVRGAVKAAACENRDGSTAAVLVNSGEETETVALEIAGKTLSLSLPRKSAATIVIPA